MFSSRVVANYLIWRIVMNRVSNMPKKFFEARQGYFNVSKLAKVTLVAVHTERMQAIHYSSS